jgi:hypothetical protein
MEVQPSVRTSAHRIALTATPLVVVALLAPSAEAAGPRPFFQMPLACGQTWEASTYDGHWPDQDSVDLGEWTTADANMSRGEPVLASADGTVDKVFTSSAGDIRVYLDHGGGWMTHYIHLEQVPPLIEGQKVAQGEQIGRVGNSGTEAYHLHYTQLADGSAVRIAFNGTLINTHAGNPSSYDTWGNGEKLTSANCPMNSFLNVDQLGIRYQLLYKPGTGASTIVELDPTGNGATGIWSSTWNKGWTHFTPFRINNQPYYFAYKSSTGQVAFDRVNVGGIGVTEIGTGTWSKGWTHFMPFTLGGQPYYVAYKSTNGGANLDRINPIGNGASTIWSGSWGKGWTHLAPFVQGGVQYFLAYQGGTGAVEIDKITGSGNSVTITEVWSSTWSKGWSHIVPITHEGAVYLLKYRSTTGAVSLEAVKSGGAGTTFRGSATWTKSWTAFSPYSIGGQGHVLVYKVGTGAVRVLKLNADETGTITLWSSGWTLGWS